MKETGQEDQKTTEFHEEARTMSRDDVHHYEGVTLDEQGREEKDDISSGFHIRIHAYEGQPWWKKVLLMAAAAGCILLFLSVFGFFLMGILVVALLGSALYFLRIFFSGK
jgi:hypothetical protein